MDFELSEERQMLKDTADRMIRERYPLDTRHAAAASDDGFDRQIWADFCELGLPGALISADHGGFGGTGEDIALVFECLGRGLVVEPFLPSLLAAIPLEVYDRDELLDQIIGGEKIAAFAHGEPDAYYAPNHVTTKAVGADGAWHLTGAKAVVINGGAADLLVVSARLTGHAADANTGLGLFLVDPTADGVEVTAHKSVDGPNVAEIRLDNAPAEPLGTPGDAWPVIEKTLAAGALAVSAEAIGAMETAKDQTLAYLKERAQFGKPIGANQVLQHRMVEMAMELEQARSAVMLAANSLEADRVTREINVSAAKNLVGRAGRLIAEEAIQMHGGVAMTWEWPLPHFAKRIIMIDHLFGDTDHHLQRYVALTQEAEAGAA
ncbi:MAG: acyl-CoA dehydrogenase family protein [Pseudomonadota bacterium]